MKPEGVFKTFIVPLLGAVLVYFVTFGVIQHFRDTKGPWQVTFQTDAAGRPSLQIAQSSLQLSNITIKFIGEQIGQSNLNEMVLFDSPKTNVPFGRVIFFDTTFLPGTMTFDLFGHEIELLPRALGVNRKAVQWQSGLTIELAAEQKPVTPPQPPKRKR
jgi:hypothetical protein